MMVAIGSRFLQLGHPFVERAQAIDDTGILSDHRRHLFEHPDQRLLVSQHDRGQHLDVVAHGCDLIKDPLLLGGKEFRVTVSAMPLSGKPSEMGGDLNHSV